MSQASLIDRIVAGVLQQLEQKAPASTPVTGQPNTSKAPPAGSEPPRQEGPVLKDKVITAELLRTRLTAGTPVVIIPKAIITPAAWDYLRENDIEVRRNQAGEPGAIGSADRPAPVSKAPASDARRLLIVVQHTAAVDRLWADIGAQWRREMLGCPDDAARMAIAELARGGISQVVILAGQTLRAACLANRHEAVKAAAVSSAADIKQAVKQLRVNTWCIDPEDRSWFELRTLFNALLFSAK